MGTIEENSKKREKFKEKFYKVWSFYCLEKNMNTNDDLTLNFDFGGIEKYYLTDAELFLGWYLFRYKGKEDLIPNEISKDYPFDIKKAESDVSKALTLFYETSINQGDVL